MSNQSDLIINRIDDVDAMPKLTWNDNEITDDMLDTPITKKMIIFICSEGVSLWPEIGDELYREENGRLRVRRNG